MLNMLEQMLEDIHRISYTRMWGWGWGGGSTLVVSIQPKDPSLKSLVWPTKDFNLGLNDKQGIENFKSVSMSIL